MVLVLWLNKPLEIAVGQISARMLGLLKKDPNFHCDYCFLFPVSLTLQLPVILVFQKLLWWQNERLSTNYHI
jgi:hypothetical protein